MLKGVLLVVSSRRLSENASLSALLALKSSLIGILTILSLNEKSPNVFGALGDLCGSTTILMDQLIRQESRFSENASIHWGSLIESRCFTLDTSERMSISSSDIPAYFFI